MTGDKARAALRARLHADFASDIERKDTCDGLAAELRVYESRLRNVEAMPDALAIERSAALPPSANT
jgi:hypothetical protein